jgi:hypothetical protein
MALTADWTELGTAMPLVHVVSGSTYQYRWYFKLRNGIACFINIEVKNNRQNTKWLSVTSQCGVFPLSAMTLCPGLKLKDIKPAAADQL